MLHIAYYISGHGYGHAVRSIEIIKALSRHNPYLFFHLKTSAPKWFFQLNLESNYLYYSQNNDVGTIQHHFHEVDKPATLKGVQELLANRERFIEHEALFLREKKIQLVIGDIPPLAFFAAAAAFVPAVAVGNFSWDWIYGAYVLDFPEFAQAIAEIRRGYAQARVLLRLPMHGPMDAFPKIIDISLIARKARRKSKDVRSMLGIPRDGKRLVLVALRAADLQRVAFKKLAHHQAFRFILLGQQKPVADMINLAQNLMPFQELLNAADVVVSKPGYGIVSECIANRKLLVYTERKDFLEYPILVAAIEKYGMGKYLPPEDFFSGNWLPTLESGLQKSWQAEEIPLDGAEQAAIFLNRFFSD